MPKRVVTYLLAPAHRSRAARTAHRPGATARVATWHHVTLVLDPAIWAATVYLDGAVVQTCDYQGGVLASGHKALVLGNYFNKQYSDAGAFTGSLDDVRFYARALSPKEISQIYNGVE